MNLSKSEVKNDGRSMKSPTASTTPKTTAIAIMPPLGVSSSSPLTSADFKSVPMPVIRLDTNATTPRTIGTFLYHAPLFLRRLVSSSMSPSGVRTAIAIALLPRIMTPSISA